MEAQHSPAYANLPGRAELQCVCGHSLLILTCVCYSQEIVTLETRLVRQEDAALAFSASQNFTMIFFPLPTYFEYCQTHVRKQESGHGEEGDGL